uniref:(northern house mosquito) hypothetical protein n=1 Tax=Culex pipiens TaxID=7175 RepID=A0A8D8D1S1_CULPI
MIGGCRLASSRQFLAQLPSPIRSGPLSACTHLLGTHLGPRHLLCYYHAAPTPLSFTFGAQIKFGKLFTFLLIFCVVSLPKIKSGGFFLFSDSSTFPLKFLAAVGGQTLNRI